MSFYDEYAVLNEYLIYNCELGDSEKVKQFIEQGADISCHGDKPLRKAIENSRYNIVIYLLKNGANINVPESVMPSDYNKSGLILAIQNEDLDMVKLIVELTLVDIKFNEFEAIKLACKCKTTDILEQLLEQHVKLDFIPYPIFKQNRMDMLEKLVPYLDKDIGITSLVLNEDINIDIVDYLFENGIYTLDIFNNIVEYNSFNSDYYILNKIPQRKHRMKLFKCFERHGLQLSDESKSGLVGEACFHGNSEFVEYMMKNGYNYHENDDYILGRIVKLAFNWAGYSTTYLDFLRSVHELGEGWSQEGVDNALKEGIDYYLEWRANNSENKMKLLDMVRYLVSVGADIEKYEPNYQSDHYFNDIKPAVLKNGVVG